MSEYKEGELILIISKLKFYKIETIRYNGSIVTLWLKDGKNSFPIKAVKGSNLFVLPCVGSNIHKDSFIIKVKTIINFTGFGLVVLSIIHFLDKFM